VRCAANAVGASTTEVTKAAASLPNMAQAKAGITSREKSSMERSTRA
jgi:hypothetical protein